MGERRRLIAALHADEQALLGSQKRPGLGADPRRPSWVRRWPLAMWSPTLMELGLMRAAAAVRYGPAWLGSE